MAPIQKKPAAKTDSVRIKKESNVLNCRVRRVVNSPNVAEARGGGVRWKLCLENASSFQLYADNRLPPAVQAKILYRSYLYLEQNKKRDNFNQAMVADFNKKLCEETWEEWVKLSNMASAKSRTRPCRTLSLTIWYGRRERAPGPARCVRWRRLRRLSKPAKLGSSRRPCRS